MACTLVGALPTNKRQNAEQGLPLALLFEEALLAGCFEPEALLRSQLARLERAYAEAKALASSEGDVAAIARLKRIVGQAPDFAEAWFSLARLQERSADPEAAAQALDRVVALDPNRGEAWNLLAVSAWQKGETKLARERFDRALAVAPYLPEALVGAGGLALARGDLPTARRMLARLEAIESYGPTPEAAALRERIVGAVTKR